MAQRLILTLWQGGLCLKAEHHCLKAEHCGLNSYGQSAATSSGKSTPLQLYSLLVSPSPLLTGQVLERIATEFNQLQFHAVQSKGMPLLDKVRPVSAGGVGAGLWVAENLRQVLFRSTPGTDPELQDVDPRLGF